MLQYPPARKRPAASTRLSVDWCRRFTKAVPYRRSDGRSRHPEDVQDQQSDVAGTREITENPMSTHWMTCCMWQVTPGCTWKLLWKPSRIALWKHPMVLWKMTSIGWWHVFKRGDLSFYGQRWECQSEQPSEEEIIAYITKKQFVDKLLTEVRVRAPGKPEKAVRTVGWKSCSRWQLPADDEDTIMKNFQHYQARIESPRLSIETEIWELHLSRKRTSERARSGFPHWYRFRHRWNPFKTVFDGAGRSDGFGEDYEPIRVISLAVNSWLSSPVRWYAEYLRGTARPTSWMQNWKT